MRWLASSSSPFLPVELARPLGHQPVEDVGAGLHLGGHPREGAGEVAELVVAVADARELRRVEPRVLECRRRIGDPDHRRGDLPPHVEPADEERAEDADRVEDEERRLADVDGAVRGGHRQRRPRFDMRNEIVDVAGQRRRDGARLGDDRVAAACCSSSSERRSS